MTASRVITTVLIASCCLVGRAAHAQYDAGRYSQPPGYGGPSGGPGYGSGYGAGAYPPPMYQQPGYPPQMQMQAAPVYMDQGRYGQPASQKTRQGGGGIEQATYTKDYPPARFGQRLIGREGPNSGRVGPTDPAIPYQMATPYTAVPGQGYYGPDGIVTKHNADEDSWDEAGPLELMLVQAFRNTWFRAEYLLWDVQGPHGERLGAPLANNTDLNEFTVIDPGSFPQQLGFAHVLTTDELDLKDTNGLKLTFGIPTTYGDIELSGFALDNQGDKVTAGNLPSPPVPFGNFIATSTFPNGQLGSNVFLYDEAFVMSYDSDVWGADIKYIIDTAKPGEGFKLRPLVGARFLNVREKLNQTGVYNQRRTLPDLVSVIDSEANNHFFGGMLGGRAEFVHRWFTVGVEPRMSLGVNRYLARVETKNLRSFGDGIVRTEEKDTVFAPVFEGTAYLNVNVSENFSLYAGYNFIGIINVTRPAKNIFYNDNGPLPTPPGVVVDAKLNEMYLRGLNVGGEYRFR